MFEVSPDTSGFLMRPSGAGVQTPVASFPFPQAANPFNDPVLGDPKVFAQCALIPGSDTPMTLPVYTMPSGLSLMPGQSSVQTVLASAVPSWLEGWSSGAPRPPDSTLPVAHRRLRQWATVSSRWWPTDGMTS